MKQRRRHRGLIEFFVGSFLLHVLPFACAGNRLQPPLIPSRDTSSTIPIQNGNIYPIFFAFSLHSFGVSSMTVLKASQSVCLPKKYL
jgi:hypothetical protein